MVQVNSVFAFGLILVSSWTVISAGVTVEEAMGRGFGLDCDGSYSLACFKKDVVSYIEKLSNLDEINILPGMSVVKDESANVTKTADMVAGKYIMWTIFQLWIKIIISFRSLDIARSYPNDPAQRLDGFLLAKLSNYLQSHTLKMKLFDGESLEKVESAFQGRKGKIGKKGGLEGLLAAAMMMKGKVGQPLSCTSLLLSSLSFSIERRSESE